MFMALMLLILLGINGLLLWRLLILNSRAKNAKGVSELARHNSKGLDDEREQMFLESKISAEENMTQPFEPMYISEKRNKSCGDECQPRLNKLLDVNTEQRLS